MPQSPTKRRRSKEPESLDWRSLASGPALRGLSEVLSTPSEVSRDRAAMRIAIDTPTEPDPPTVGVFTSVGASLDYYGSLAKQDFSPTVGVTPDHLTPTVPLTPTEGVPPVTRWIDTSGTAHEPRRVKRVEIAQHSMTLGEERFYQSVWNGTASDGVAMESPQSKIFSLGYDRLAKLVRLDEKSVRMLIPKLVAKQIIEILANEVSASRIGRTYRIYSLEHILERQRAANLTHIVKKGRAVEFVIQSEVPPPVGVSSPMTMETALAAAQWLENERKKHALVLADVDAPEEAKTQARKILASGA